MIRYPNIKIAKGKTTFIHGPSGCGKSTLLKLINGTTSPDSGEIFYKGNNIENIDTIDLRREILLVAQSVFLFTGTIEENFKKYYEYRDRDLPTKETMEKFLKICSAEFPLETRCETMSGGERQRVYIAIFLSFMPDVLMLDEPTSALDNTSSDIMMSNIKNFTNDNEMTTIVVSHYLTLAEKYGDEIIALERSKP
ncbi:MAG: ATP-binding cassette domain-containing protein [Synergistaceae bacterium]|jgi:putative ABC transport system ATP-binding protein|nr:ATP-binding cassette domain-containing protein [Synergistaceae bacterium]